ncbi:M20/M25/M40 family metallo-hydrolase [Actinoallomurus purpureus]|uniref:M20/M25/M40 family metallo-hydrolase n=1 Tax=Actinoallomurus purpureus TaxID=478114 RepID=UPI002093ECA5|nr:M20/M25/M40 family metallo-hydrolase [Actinoallomurus purpureus]MCO6006203.1 M20/M25/M40 family metallo-hydrolase [Actinoallomurus purpureus]
MRKLAISTLIGLAAASIGAAAPADAAARPRLDKLVKLKDIRRHQKDLQTIATYNGGTRAAGESGFEISTKYVVKQLKKAGYRPTVQDFPFDYYKEKTPAVLDRPGGPSYVYGTDYATLDFSGSGDVTAVATAVDAAGAGVGSGCEADDFAGFPKGNIALVKRGGCNFSVKAGNAQTAGAAAIAIYNDGASPERMGPVQGTASTPWKIPVIGPTYQLGTDLVKDSASGTLKLHIKTDTFSEKRTAHNVLAETRRGRADNVVVLGAHLDSVTAGPGINDNGSGTATVLTIAEQIDKLGKGIKNKVRFAFWGAEEEGLLGSEYYVEHLTAAQKSRIALNLNFDMLGSPNGVRGVYDGDDSEGAGTNPPAGSGAIEKVFLDYYGTRKLATSPSEFNGRSDYGPFIENGIPAGGLDSGAEKLKTEAEAKIYGGEAGKAYDPCYHLACDTYANNNSTILDQLADGAAHAAQVFAGSTLPVNGGRVAAPKAAKARAHTPVGRDLR